MLTQHGFRKDPIAPRRVIDKYMCDCTYESAILDDRAATHALDDAAGTRQQPLIGHAVTDAFVRFCGMIVNPFYLDIISQPLPGPCVISCL